MNLRPLNKTIVILPDRNDYQCDDSLTVLNTLRDPDRRIILPEHNTLEKISSFGTVVAAANDCWYPYKKGQKIFFDRFADTPLWHEEDGVKYRLIKEHYVKAIIEDD
jgi:co-chaperonin GroES (HSP10)